MEQQQSDKFVRQQKLMVLMVVICSVMMITVVVLGWYIFDYSSTKIQKNSETIAALLKNSNLANSGKVSDISNNTSDLDLSKKEQIDYQNLKPNDVIKMVNRHILLADGDITVATVTNVEGLRTDYPELFTYAKTGDKLIFYALGIIVYDPVRDRVVDVLRRLPEDTNIPKSATEEK